ncbi:MAG: S8 family serine peptidase [Prevotella sp.]|jgi:serine protease AprX
MKKFLLIFLIAISCTTASAQHNSKVPYPDGQFNIFRVSLKDKKGSEYSLKHPEKFLSSKALRRRAKQHLPIDSTDLPLSKKYISKLTKEGLQIIGGSKWNNTVLIKSTDAYLTPKLAQFPFVTNCVKVFTTPDSIFLSHPDSVVVDSVAMAKTSTHRYGHGQHQIEMLNGLKLHEAGFKGDGMLIAIVDGGYMNVNRIDYFKNVNIIGQRDFVYPYTANLYDLLDHGTMVLSDIGANVEGKFIGTAPHALFLLLRSEDGRTESLVEEDYWAQAVEYADSVGADVLNSSLGYSKFDDKTTNHKYVEQDGKTTLISRTASMIASKGMLLVNSAGNEGMSTWKRTNCPADATDILAVAALSADSVNARFSSVGPSYDGRVKPDVAAQGVASTVIDGSGVITTANGTSFASPITCGMVACLWQALPHKTAIEIMNLVRKSADRASTPDNIFGYGIPDYWKAYQEGKKEEGRINEE